MSDLMAKSARQINQEKYKELIKLLRLPVWNKDVFENIIGCLSMTDEDLLSHSVDVNFLEVVTTDPRARSIRLARYAFSACQHFIRMQKFFVDQTEFNEILDIHESGK